MKTLCFCMLILLFSVPMAAADDCVPGLPGNVHAQIPVKTWYKQNTLTVSWTEAAGCGSEIARYEYLWNTSEPDTTFKTDQTQAVSHELDNGSRHYFHIRTVEMNGKASSTVHLGPFYIDTALPCDINGDEKVELSDAVLAVKISCGENTENTDIQSGSGVEPGGIIGLTSAIFVLRKIAGPWPGDCLNAEEIELARLINEYRKENRLTELPVSKSLTAVAQWHVTDLFQNKPDTDGCNMHSWSDKGIWTSVCFPKETSWSKMESKPREITNNIYTGNAYEIAYGTMGQVVVADVLSDWKNSLEHNKVILQQGDWAKLGTWSAMGVGIYGGYAVAWFGVEADPQGSISACQ
ncbi:MAG: hypothetical protein BWK80_45770 [Desulfobacteraceae bacterium IS3]|nr:MAG: hypothetical protein BWK80_45770 [Desulfobacteraceae bacterium IS3]